MLTFKGVGPEKIDNNVDLLQCGQFRCYFLVIFCGIIDLIVIVIVGTFIISAIGLVVIFAYGLMIDCWARIQRSKDEWNAGLRQISTDGQYTALATHV
jgi:hypothetical protein